ncbi:MAG TPA: ADP-ribosylglycohydrolase family protein [Oscillatoriales cyanobacterium M59_W2019_021]|nr:ADP-ribosylglycohydrolase family protein [Oscillatoriales cyanobacterium M59_W2019_021]
MMPKPQTQYDAAMGCLLGALSGDAAGATLEFWGRKPTVEDVDWAMQMSGGGVWNVAPGQITDDGELTLCLAQALAESSHFDIESIARNYARWVDSNPFDIGSTTAKSLGAYARVTLSNLFAKNRYAATMTQAAAERCMSSKANGSLMRISPLGLWGFRSSDHELANFARRDSQLSHPNPSCGYAAACYVIAIASLMRELGDRMVAFQNAKNWLKSQIEGNRNPLELASREEVLGWLNDAETNTIIEYSPHEGFVKIAFTHAFRHLLLGSDYETAIRETLAGGGDTDTNACIVGGLIGAACGVDAIPETMKRAVLNCDTKLGQNPRPEFLNAQQVPFLVERLLRSRNAG